MSRALDISSPEHLTAAHDLSTFDSGTPELDNWLKRRALANEALGSSRTYVVVAGGRAVGFYAIANGAVAHKDVSAKARRNLPDPIPVMVLARLAVDSAYQNQGLGSALLKDALLRTLAAAQIAGIRAVLLHAMSDDAKRFYVRSGFHECPVDPMMMMVTLEEVEQHLGPGNAT
ncbi:MAG: GNAT family N-acetyltransferase [Vicinamibacterales bacterium]